MLAARGVGPGDHVACYLYNSIEYLEVMLAAFKLRAVPINVNYRYVEDELRYLLDDADVKAVVFHREFAPKLAAIRSSLPDAAHVPRGRRRQSAPTTVDALAALDYEPTLAAAVADARLRAALRRRPLHPLHRRHHRHAQGRDVAPRGRLLRRARRAADGGGKPITTPEEIAERCTRASHRGACPRARSCTAPRTGWRSARCSRAARSCIPAEHHLDALALWRLVEREQANFMVIVGDAFARPMLDALEQRRGPLDRRVAAARAAVGRRDPLALVEARARRPAARRARRRRLRRVGDGGQGQSVVVSGGDIPASPQFRVVGDTLVLGDDLRPARPAA